MENTPCTLFYIINHKWMRRFFTDIEEAKAYAKKRLNEPNFKFRHISGKDFMIDNPNDL